MNVQHWRKLQTREVLKFREEQLLHTFLSTVLPLKQCLCVLLSLSISLCLPCKTPGQKQAAGFAGVGGSYTGVK